MKSIANLPFNLRLRRRGSGHGGARTQAVCVRALLAVLLVLGWMPSLALAGTTQVTEGTSASTVKITAVSTGVWHSAAVDENGGLWTWGENPNGELGRETATSDGESIPRKVLDDVAYVDCGAWNTAAVKEDGSLWVWGWNGENALLGLNPEEYPGIVSEPVKLMDEVASVDIACACIDDDWDVYGGEYMAVVKTDGSLWVWGSSLNGQAGGVVEWVNEPVKLLEGVTQVSCGAWHVAAITSDGSLYTWGFGAEGRLGSGDEDDVTVPCKVMDDVKQVSCGMCSTLAVTNDGCLCSFGDATWGVLLVNPDKATKLLEPTQVMDGVASASICYKNAGIVKMDGTLWTCGNNAYGYLGAGRDDYSGDPDEANYVPIQIMSDVEAISYSGRSFAAALKTDGTVWTWGENGYNLDSFGFLGRLGVGPFTDIPGQVIFDEKNNVSKDESGDGGSTGKWSQYGSCEWLVDAKGLLTIRPINGSEGGVLDSPDELYGDWPWLEQWDDIVAIEVSPGVKAGNSLAYAFSGLSYVREIDLSGIDTSDVTKMNEMFWGCASLMSIDVSCLDTSKTTNMSGMFEGCSSLTAIDLSSFDTSHVENMVYMFGECTSLAKVTLGSKFVSMGDSASFGMFPEPDSESIQGADGYWHALSDGKSYLPEDVPLNKADTYYAVAQDRDIAAGFSGEEPDDAGGAVSDGDKANAGNSDAGSSSGTKKPVTSVTKAGVTYTISGKVAQVTKVAISKKSVTIKKSVKIGSKTYKVSGIAAKAFKGTKAARVTVKSTTLTKKSVKNSLKGSKVKTVKVPKAKRAAYKKLFKKAVCGKKVTVK